MNDAHAEFCKSAQERHFLGADLPRAEPRNRVAAEFVLDGFEAQRKNLQRCVPVDRFELTGSALRRYGVVARSGACNGVSASQPFGQAIPRLTG